MSTYTVYAKKGFYAFGSNGRINRSNGKLMAYIINPITNAIDESKPGLIINNIYSSNIGKTLFQFFGEGV